MNNIEKALRYFKSRKAMMLTDQIQAYEDIAITALEHQLADKWILDTVKAIGECKTVTCTVGDGNPITYKVKYIDDADNPYWGEECLTIDGKVYDFRNFNISISQILYGKWEVSEW